MRNVSDNYKEDIVTYGRQFDFKISIDDVNIDNDNINFIKPSFNTALFKTIMHKVEIDSKYDIDKKSKIDVQVGLKVNEPNYEYIKYNTYYVNSSERKEDTLSYVITAYDKMIESMIDYDLDISEKIKLREYLIKICQRLGWDTKNIPATFINSEKLVNPILHTAIGYTFRDVLDEIATISCSFLLFKDGEFYLMYPTETNENIDESYLNEDDVTIGEKYFINSLVFSRAEESDNIYRSYDESIQENGLHEYRISDNQLLSTNDRDLYIDEMFNYLKYFEFYVFDIKSKGILFLEACDRFNLALSGKIYSTILLNNETEFADGLTESIYIDAPEETETDYRYADKTDKKINQAYIMVDKQNQKIESVVNSVTEQNDKISKVTQTVDKLNSKISDIADITTSGESIYGKLEFTSVNQSEPILVKIHPLGTNISYLYPHSNLYPSSNLYPTTRILRFSTKDSESVEKNIDYLLPDDFLYYDNETYDEFYLSYDSQICQVIKRCGYNEDGTVYKLDKEVVTDYEYPKIELTDGDYTVSLLGYETAYLYVTLMAQNIYTTQFATKAEVSSEINQTAQDINLSVDKKLTLHPTTTEMNSAINMTANSITSTVSQNYATKTELSSAKSEIKQTTDSITSTVSKKVGNDEIISKINQSAETVGINANKIELSAIDILNLLAGNTINLTSKNIVISSNNFSVDKNGNMQCKNATVTGGSFNVKAATGATDTIFRITNSKNTDEYMYAGPVVFHSQGNGGYITLQPKSTVASNSILILKGSTTTTIRDDGISTPKVTQTSLESEKKNFEEFKNAIDIIKNIDIYKYNLKNEKDGTKKHIGFVIGDKFNYSEEVTSEDNDGVDIYSFVSMCCQSIKEQQTIIEKLQKQIKEMKGEQE